MIKIVLYISFALFAVCSAESGRPKPRLLFYDEEGNLVKTYSNPYLQNLRLNAGMPLYGNFLNPLFGFIKDLGSLFAFTVPVSNEVIQQINKDPQYHSQLLLTHTTDPIIEPNPLCEGRRAQIPSPNLCNNYLNCWDGWAVEQECPTGLLFSKQGYCDYSDNVNCESRKLREQPPTQPQCKKDFETFRNQLNCNEFFVCVNRQPVKFKCPADLAYNQLLGVCDYQTRVDCSSSAVNTEIFSTQPPSPAPDSSTTAAPIIPALPSVFPAIIPPSGPIIPSVPISPQAPIKPPAPIDPQAPIIPPAPINPPASIDTPAPMDPTVPIDPPASINPLVPMNPQDPIIPQAPIVPTAPIVPPAPIIPPTPINVPAISQPTQSPLYPNYPIIYPMPFLPATVNSDESKTIYSENSIVNTQSWTSTHIATSLQDAISQLQHKNIAKAEV